MSSSTTRTLSCRCLLHSWTFTHASTAPPQTHTFCHCSACRHRTGSLAVVRYYCTGEMHPPDEMVKTSKEYRTSGEAGNRTTHFFCGDCGTTLFARNDDAGGPMITADQTASRSKVLWSISASALDRTEGLYDLIGHEHLFSTHDGGLANWLLDVGAPGIPRDLAGSKTTSVGLWSGSSDDPTTRIKQLPYLTAQQLEASSKVRSLRFHCHCESTSIYVSLPTSPTTRNVPYWLVPPLNPSFKSPGIAVEGGASGDEQVWRRRGRLCACKDCTTSSGVAYPAAAWVDVPFKDMYMDKDLTQRWVDSPSGEDAKGAGEPSGADSGSLGVGPEISGVERYESTPGKTTRYFCPTCGAKILLLTHLNPSVPRLSAALLQTYHPAFSTSDEGESIIHGLLAPQHIAWWAGANVCQSVADMGLEDSLDAELGRRLAEGLVTWSRGLSAKEGEVGLTSRQERETARPEEAKRGLEALRDD